MPPTSLSPTAGTSSSTQTGGIRKDSQSGPSNSGGNGRGNRQNEITPVNPSHSFDHPPLPSSSSSTTRSSTSYRRHPQPISASSRHQLDPVITTAIPLPAGSIFSNEESYATSSSNHPWQSPSTPTQEATSSSGITRRRLSIPTQIVRPRRKTLVASDHPSPHSPSSPAKRCSERSGSFSWLTGGGRSGLLHPPVVEKQNKSDDEREEEEDDDKRGDRRTPVARPRRRKSHWWNIVGNGTTPETTVLAPLISMTPPGDWSSGLMGPPLPVPAAFSPRQYTMDITPLAPLPQDPNHILPLSLPVTPAHSPPPSTHPTPFITPHTSLADLAAEYGGLSMSMTGPSATSSSPRTSISTSSSRIGGWQSTSTAATRSDSRSSTEDDSPTFTHTHIPGKGWFLNNEYQDKRPQSKVVNIPGIPSQPILPVKVARVGHVPLHTRSRNWSWVMESLRANLGWGQSRLRLDGSRPKRGKERARSMAGHGRRRESQVLGSKWLGRAMAFVPTTLWSTLLTLIFIASLVVGITMTFKHVLNPDKEALPWRSYCTAEYPTLYSLQHPDVPSPSFLSYLASPTDQDPSPFTSPAAPHTFPSNTFASLSDLALRPLTPNDPTWPYHPSNKVPQSTDPDVGAIQPVGILIGVFTTDQGAGRRHMIRQSYASHWRSRRLGTEGVKVRFIMGRPRAKYAEAVKLEVEAFNDILMLDIPENMNSGKTHAFFSWAAENATVPYYEYPESSLDGSSTLTPVYKGERPPAYVAKADDDSFIMLGELERRLRVAPRTKTYWGYLVKNFFMAGECYALSFDLVQYIAASPALRSMKRGKEDKLVSKWMRMHPERETITWVAERCGIYDHPKAGTVYSHGFLFPSTIEQVRIENATGLAPNTLAARGGPESANTYSSVSKFGKKYRPLHHDMSAGERVEALIEGSPLSLVKPHSDAVGMRRSMDSAYESRLGRKERYLGDEGERGGTVVVHYIKKQEWFVETMVALLGGGEEKEVERR